MTKELRKSYSLFFLTFTFALPLASSIAAQTAPVKVFNKASVVNAKRLSLSKTSTQLDDEGGRTIDISYIRSSSFLDDGTTVVLSAMGTSNWLAHFSTKGKLLRTLGGGRGSGPGDFRSPIGLAVTNGDTLLIADPGNDRLNRVLINSGKVEVVRVDSLGLSPTAYVVGVLPKNRFVLTNSPTFRESSRGRQTHSDVPVLVRTVKNDVKTIARVMDLRLSQVETRLSPVGTMTVITRLAPQASVVLWDTVVVTTAGSPAELSLLNANGTTLGRITFPFARRPVTNAMKKDDIAKRLAVLDGFLREPPIDKNEVKRIERITPFSDSLPIFERLFVGTDGLLWALEAIAPGDKEWSAIAISKSREIVGRLTGGSEQRPIAFGAGQVMLRSEGSDGLVTLAVRGIEGLTVEVLRSK